MNLGKGKWEVKNLKLFDNLILIDKQRFHDMNSEVFYLLRRLQILFSVLFKP